MVQPKLLAEVAQPVSDVARENIPDYPGSSEVLELVSFLRNGGGVDFLGELEEEALSGVVGESVLG